MKSNSIRRCLIYQSRYAGLGVLFVCLFVWEGLALAQKTPPPTRDEIIQQRKDAAIKRNQERDKLRRDAELNRINSEIAAKAVSEQTTQVEIQKAEAAKLQAQNKENAQKAEEEKRILHEKLLGTYQEKSEAVEENSNQYFQLLPDQRIATGMNLLFDGQTMTGWRVQTEGPYGGGRFTIENGMICSDPAHPGLLYTTGQYGDLRLEFEVQAEDGAEAFFLLHTSPNPKNLKSSCRAILLASKIQDRHPATFYGIKNVDAVLPDDDLSGKSENSKSENSTLQRDQANDLGTQQNQTNESSPDNTVSDNANPLPSDNNPAGNISSDSVPSEKNVKKERPWRKFVITTNDILIQVNYGGIVENSLLDRKPLRKGFLGFLVTKGKIRIRNVFWNAGGYSPLFDGSDISGWTFLQQPGMSIAVESQILNLQGGPGMIETNDQFDHFVLNLEFRTSIPGSDSGVFFRCIPNENLNGYECQINANPSEELRQNQGAETGGLFQLKSARSIKVKQGVWNSLTLSAVDNHIQTWVNGIQALDYSDRRPTDPNPRQGLRLLPGTIQLQGRDTGTQIEFRKIYISKVPQRRDTK